MRGRMLLGLCLLTPTVASAQTAPPPISVYVHAEPGSNFALSPDGEHVAFVSDEAGGHLISVLASGDAPPETIKVDWVQSKSLRWLDSDHLMLSRRELVDTEFFPKQVLTQAISYNIHTHASSPLLINTSGSAPVLTGGRLVPGIYNGRHVIYMKGFAPGPSYALYRVDLDSGQGALVSAGTLASEAWVTTAAGEVVATSEVGADHGPPFFRVKEAKGWRNLASKEIGDDVSLVGLGRTEGALAFARGPDLVEMSRVDGSLSAPLQPPGSEAYNRYTVDSTGLLAAISVSGDIPSYIFFDAHWKAGWTSALKAFPGARVRLVDESDDGRRLIVLVENYGAAIAGAYYYVDLAHGRAEMLKETRPGLASDQVAQTSTFDFKASDGLSIRGVLTLPPHREPKNLPLVVLVRGPSFHADLTFDTEAQVLASRGYAVLKVVGRGAGGGDENLRAAGFGQIGRKMQSDLSDGVNELVRQGVADKARVCIMGEGFGGYAALAGVSIQSGIYKCAVAIDPVVDLNKAVRRPADGTYGPAWSSYEQARRYIGTDVPGKLLSDLSPAVRPQRFSGPVLVIEDSLAAQADQTERMVKALRAVSKPVDYLPLKTEDGLKDAEGMGAMTYNRIISFLEASNPAS